MEKKNEKAVIYSQRVNYLIEGIVPGVSMARILCAAIVDPPYRYSTKEILEGADRLWLQGKTAVVRETALRLMGGADIDTRYSVQPLDVVFSDLGFGIRNDLFIEASKKLAAEALRKACEKIDLSPASLDAIITTSCTGFMIPSVDAFLVDELGLSQHIIRMPITEMGCAGGTAALSYGRMLLQSPNVKRVAIVSVETPSLTFQKNDDTMENLVSTAIFADGAAAVVLGRENEPLRESWPLPEIIDTAMYHFPKSTDLMGYQLTDSGLKIVLSRKVPDEISAHFRKFMDPFLARNNLTIDQIDRLLFHPGGKKILQQTETLLKAHGKNVDLSKKVLRERGNLSSATVLHVLEETMRDDPKEGALGYMLAFGPGFTAHSLLLRWSSRKPSA